MPFRHLHAFSVRVFVVIAIAVVFAAGIALIWAPADLFAQEGDSSPVAEVSPRLEAALAQALAAEGNETVEIVAVLREQVSAAEVVAQSAQTAEVHTYNAAIYDALTDAAHASQDSLLAWLNARGVTYRAYYIVNMVLIYGDAALVDELRERPEIARLALNVATEGIESTPNGASSMALPAGWSVAPAAAQSVAPPWGISFIHAPEVWAMGYTGAGIVVASQDTGVQWDHPALQLAYRGWNTATMTATHTYNWFDAWGADGARASRCDGEAATNAQIPCDDNGHGTHTVGTMLGNASGDGGTIIGVAPDAKWIACRNMTSGVGSPTSYADCFQFFLAPYPQDGDPMTDGDPSRAPNIINNSWSCPTREGCDDPNILRSIVETVRAAGQFVVSSAGNSGAQGCSSINTPIAIYDASYTVGAIDNDGGLSSFSSRGPVTIDGSGRPKPDIAAPGSGVYSSYPQNSYTYLNGTSMASPHVAGAVALLWSAVPALIGDIDRTEQILRDSATPVVYDNCGGALAAGGGASNNGYGAGQLNLQTAVQLAFGTGPSLTVTVVNTAGQVISGSVVSVVNLTLNQTITATTDALGVASFDSLLTNDWQGARAIYFLVEGATPPLIYTDAPNRLFLPLFQCDTADCHTASATPFTSPFTASFPTASVPQFVANARH